MNPVAVMTPEASAELDERRLQVVADQATGLRWQIALTATIVAAIVWRSAPWPVVVAWFVAVIGTREWRALALARMTRERHRAIVFRLQAMVRWNVLIGACNGSAALFMARLDPALDAVLTMVLISWGAGAVSTSATVMPAFLVYAGLLYIPTAFMWGWMGGWLGWGVCALVLMFFGVQYRFARRNMETFEESFGIRLENETLARTLEFERAQLTVARDAAVRANQDKSRFLAGASHDLRQPLQAMSLNVGALQHLSMSSEAHGIVAVVDSSLDQLRSMLDALLDVAKLDAGVVPARPRRIQLDRLLSAVVASFGAAAAARSVELHAACPAGLAVVSDPDLLRRLLGNLIDNAIKFAPVGGHVRVHVMVDAEGAELSVQDDGPGIAPEHHRIVFEDLVQLEPVGVAPTPGHGLGLGIVRRLAQLLELALMLESDGGSGTTFRTRLPLAVAEPDASDDIQQDESLAGRVVLVLDDDPMVRGAYLNALRSMGCRVLPAATIDDALAHCVDARPDAVVVDYRLGGGADGLMAIDRLRETVPDMPIVMVTADADPALVDAAQRRAAPLLRKPVDSHTLGRALGAVMAPV